MIPDNDCYTNIYTNIWPHHDAHLCGDTITTGIHICIKYLRGHKLDDFFKSSVYILSVYGLRRRSITTPSQPNG